MNSTTLWTSTYADEVFNYIGYDYDSSKAVTLYGINQLAHKNRLILCRRQISNRDVRILIRNNDDDEDDDTRTDISEIYNINKSRYKRYSNESMNKNYDKFLFNFNKLAIACYLTALKASDNLWSAYNVPTQLSKDTNFYVIESSPKINERYMRKILEEKEFVQNYIGQLHNVHHAVANRLHKNLNTKPIRHNSFYIDPFNNEYTITPQTKSPDVHLFRSFRVLGLRHRINRPSNKENTNTLNSNTNKFNQQQPQQSNIKVDQFSEIVEIRCAFDIRQFENKTSYDCFIECEMSYYKVIPEKVTQDVVNLDPFWLNYVNKNEQNNTTSTTNNNNKNSQTHKRSRRSENIIKTNQIASHNNNSLNNLNYDSKMNLNK